MKIHLIHGIRSRETGGKTAYLRPYFEAAGMEVVVHDYGFSPVGVNWALNPRRAKQIAEQVEDGDVLVGHSNGCTISHRISRDYKKVGLVFINPALDANTDLSNSLWVDVYHHPQDRAVALAELIPFGHSWGDMGKVGATDGKAANYDTSQPPSPYLPALAENHGKIFSHEYLRFWGPFIAENVRLHVHN